MSKRTTNAENNVIVLHDYKKQKYALAGPATQNYIHHLRYIAAMLRYTPTTAKQLLYDLLMRMGKDYFTAKQQAVDKGLLTQRQIEEYMPRPMQELRDIYDLVTNEIDKQLSERVNKIADYLEEAYKICNDNMDVNNETEVKAHGAL